MLLKHLLTFDGKEVTKVNEADVDNILDLLDCGAGVLQMPRHKWPRITAGKLDLDKREETLEYLAAVLQTQNTDMERSLGLGINPDAQPAAAAAVQPAAAAAVQPAAAAAVQPKKSRSPPGRVQQEISKRKEKSQQSFYSHTIAAFACAGTQLRRTVRTHATRTPR